MRLALLIVIAALASISLRSTAPATAASPGAQGLIAFHRFEGFQSHIWVMNSDGSGQRQLTSGAWVDQLPAWSPDGRQIAFRSNRADNTDVWIMNADGSNPRRLTTNPAIEGSATWSPDGTQLVFDSLRNGNVDVFAINVDGTNERNISNHPAHDFFPNWSPDGSRISFQSQRDGNYDVYTMRPDGSDVRNLTNRSDATNESADWSPDGSRLVFVSEGENHDVWTMNADGSGQRQVTTSPATDWMPAWSADGTKILFATLRDGASEIYSMNPDGSAQTRLTNNGVHDQVPDSQPLTCTVATVIDGDSFTCTDGRSVNMLQIDAPELGACGGDWAKAALQFIFLTPGRVVRLQYDTTLKEGPTDLVAPIWMGNDGNPYNLSIVMAYVGLAKAATVGAGNTRILPWAQASQTWAQAAQWNMWAPGKPFTGGC